MYEMQGIAARIHVSIYTRSMPFAPARLARLRADAVLTQRELAERAGVTHLSVHRIERGLQEPRPAMIRKLARVLGVRPQDLMQPATNGEVS